MHKTSPKQPKTNSNQPYHPHTQPLLKNQNSLPSSIPSKNKIKSNHHISPQQNKLNDKINILNVLQKYVTLQQLKKHQLSKQQQLKKINQIQTNLFIQQGQQIYSPIVNKSLHNITTHNMQENKNKAANYLQFVILERIDIDPRAKSLCIYLEHQIFKINQQINKIQNILNQNNSQIQSKIYSHLTHFLNTIILTFNFILSKQSYKQQQYLQSNQHMQLLTEQLRTQFYTLQKEYQLLRQQSTTWVPKQKQLQQQLSRIRSVMQSYQQQNFQLKKQIKILNQVIQQMNIQVQKGQIKLQNKRKQFYLLSQDYQKIVCYVKQMEIQLKEYIEYKDQAKMMKLEIIRLGEEIKKWKDRCFQEQKENIV